MAYCPGGWLDQAAILKGALANAGQEIIAAKRMKKKELLVEGLWFCWINGGNASREQGKCIGTTVSISCR